MKQQPQEWKCGAHRAHFEEPDTLVAVFSGLINLDEVKQTVSLYEETARQKGQYYLIADIGRSSLEAAGRRYMSEKARSDWYHAILYVGADIVMQTFVKAIALALLFTGKSTFETVFVKTQDEARAWIAQHRARAKSKAS
ncbi:STAS/SEC14 domain-containing protein [Myxococcus sp. Y35]|uniref:STAS/SEC14 domain-containing protein n=1 Tax=Pseudomyxococcus flavus TaxID=3115648 RepID=UPI003CE85334